MVVLSESPFSPQRPALVVLGTNELEKKSPLETPRTAKQPATEHGDIVPAVQDINIEWVLPPDVITLVQAKNWVSDRRAPLKAAVCQTWNAAAQDAVSAVAAMEVAPPRRVLKVAAFESLSYVLDADVAAKIDAWGDIGAQLPDFQTVKFKKVVWNLERPDAAALLSLDGWLTNFVIDAFFRTLMPSLYSSNDSEFSKVNEAAYFDGFVSSHIQAKGKFPDAMGMVIVDLLTVTKDVYMSYNLNKNHWALIRIRMAWKRLEVYDARQTFKMEHAKTLMNAFHELMRRPSFSGEELVRSLSFFSHHFLMIECLVGHG